MKYAVLGLSFFALVSPHAASAKDCSPPKMIYACRAMTCNCGVCDQCGDVKSKSACEARVAGKADAYQTQRAEYEKCKAENDAADETDQEDNEGEQED